MIKYLYTIFLALLVALFVGLGIDAFYPGPTPPEYPTEFTKVDPTEKEEIAKQNELQKEFSEKQKIFEEESKKYNRNVSILALSFAILILFLSMTLLSKIKVMANGILLGGVFTTAYSIIRGLMSTDSRFRFLIVSVGLIIALTLGYIKFIKGKTEEQIEL